jgi:hypothetical protein
MCVGHRHRTLAPRAQKTDEYICIACASLNHFAFSGSSPSHSHSHSHSHSLTRSGLFYLHLHVKTGLSCSWWWWWMHGRMGVLRRCAQMSLHLVFLFGWFLLVRMQWFAIRTARSCCSRPSSPPLLRDLSREGYDAATDDSTALRLLQTLLVRTIACGR